MTFLPKTIDGAALLTSVAVRASAGYKASRQSAIIREAGAMLPALIAAADLTTELRLVHFVAQTCHESDQFCAVEEYASGSAYEGRKDLGNTEPGDGVRFKGHGLIQTTGRANHRAFTLWMRARDPSCPDFEAEPARLADFPWAGFSAAMYWATRGLNAFADRDDLLTITRRINGGTNGLAERRAALGRARTAVAAAIAAGVTPASDWPILRVGSEGDEVEVLQRALATWSGRPVGIDGLFGKETRLFVMAFQRAFGLTVDGVVGKETRPALAPYIKD